MGNKTKDLCINGIVAAIYVALTMINPISWGTMQFRISNILVAAPFYNKKISAGVLVGIAIANFFSPLGLVDVFFGVFAEGIAYVIFVYGPAAKIPIWAKVIGLSLCVAFVVGAELTIIYGASYAVNFASLFVGTCVIAGIGAAIMKNKIINRVISNGKK